MTSLEVLSEIERKLDELIKNATLLKDCEEENGKCADLEHQQEMLLNDLLRINNSLDEDEKYSLWQKSPHRYTTLEKKIVKFSRLNQKLLKNTPPYVKKARVHRRKIKKPPNQLSLDFN
jgi:FtsZ-binding cell division protein ZapB